MEDTGYYVYALKDSQANPPVPFYIGKGVGTRAEDHLVRPDQTRKGMRIRAILDAGGRVLVVRLLEDLSEIQALKLEAELISAFGTIDTGGSLTNSVIPKGLGKKERESIAVPRGIRERAQIGLKLLKDAILELVAANRDGVTNSEAASLLGLRSDYGGGSKDYLSYSLLGLLMREGQIRRSTKGKRHILVNAKAE